MNKGADSDTFISYNYDPKEMIGDCIEWRPTGDSSLHLAWIWIRDHLI